MINSNIAGHGKNKGGFTHGGTGSYDHKVRILPAIGKPV